MTTKAKPDMRWYAQPQWAALVALLSLLAAYGLASRAIETGSLQQYGLAIATLWLGLNRLAHLVLAGFRKARA